MDSTVELVNFAEFERTVHRACTAISDSCTRAVVNGMRAGVDAVARSPKGFVSRTGKLAKSGRTKLILSTRGGAFGEMRWTKAYAAAIDAGSRAHEIRPKMGDIGPTREGQRRRRKDDVGTFRGKLRWRGKNGRWVFAFVVRHPGTKPSHFSQGAIDACVDVAMAEVLRGIEVAHRIMEET